MTTLAILIFIISLLLGGLILFRIYIDRVFSFSLFKDLTDEDLINELENEHN